MHKNAWLDKRCAELRRQNAEPEEPPKNSGLRRGEAADSPAPAGKIHRLGEAAKELGINVETARKLFIELGVMRFSISKNGDIALPGMIRKQRRKMTYLITDQDIEKLRSKLRGAV